MLNRLFKNRKSTEAPAHSENMDFNEFGSSELGQWIAKLDKEDFLSKYSTIKEHVNFFPALLDLPDSKIAEILNILEDSQLIELLNEQKLDDVTYILEFLGSQRQEELLPKLKRSRKIQQYLEYPIDSCGRAMETDFFTLPIDQNAQEALNFIRSHAGESQIYYLYCQTVKRKLIGVVSLRELATCKPDTPLDELVKRDVYSVLPDQDIEEAIKIVKRENIVALPVVNERTRLLGIIPVEDILDEIEDQATADIFAQAGLQEMDSVTMKAHLSYLSRAPWVVLNLFLACIGSVVISFYEPVIGRLPLLAALMPIAAGLGGNTAIQTLTIVTRGMAIGDFDYISYTKALVKEVSVGVALGLTGGFVATLIVYSWKEAFSLGLILGASMFINSFIAALLGTLVPISLKKLGKDPAVGSGVLVTTLSDMFCFFSFLTLARTFL